MKFLITVFTLTFLLTLTTPAWAQFDFDFESSSIGDPLGSLGFEGAFADETIGTFGVGGSNGLKINTQSNEFFSSAYLRNLDFDKIVSATLSIDAQYEAVGPAGRRSLFNISLGSEVNPTANFNATFTREDANQYTNFIYNGVSGDSYEESPRHDESELGFFGSGVSDFFNLSLEVEKIAANNYDITSYVYDLDNNVLNSVQIQGVDLTDALSSGPIWLGFGFNNAENIGAVSNRFDNFRFTVTSVPEPGSAIVLVGATLLLCGLRRRRLGVGYARTSQCSN